MRFRPMGRSGPIVSEIAYGTWNLPGPRISEADATRLLGTAVESGITTFDTADIYAQGASETVLGKFLASTQRDDIVICTKVGLASPGSDFTGGLSYRYVVDSCRESLRWLNTDHIDLYQAHRFDPDTPLEETIAAFAHLVKNGYILHMGVSEWPPGAIASARVIAEQMKVPFAANQCQYSMIWRVSLSGQRFIRSE